MTLFFSVCSAFSKETGITVMAVCAAYEFFIFHEVSFFMSIANYMCVLTAFHALLDGCVFQHEADQQSTEAWHLERS